MSAFTHTAYAALLETLRASGRPMGGVADFLESRGRGDVRPRIILRHDVDRRPGKAVQLATLEADVGVRATYYFRCTSSGRFPGRAVRPIAAAGHEVGYHYETLSAARGDRAKALAAFRENLAALRTLAPCTTVSMHGAPLSPHDNGTLLKGVALAEFELLGDAILSIPAEHVLYITDTGGRWDADSRVNLRDRLGTSDRAPALPDDPGFGAALARSPDTLYLSAHPERWSGGPIDAVLCRTMDAAANMAKRLLVRRQLERPA